MTRHEKISRCVHFSHRFLFFASPLCLWWIYIEHGRGRRVIQCALRAAAGMRPVILTRFHVQYRRSWNISVIFCLRVSPKTKSSQSTLPKGRVMWKNVESAPNAPLSGSTRCARVVKASLWCGTRVSRCSGRIKREEKKTFRKSPENQTKCRDT